MDESHTLVNGLDGVVGLDAVLFINSLGVVSFVGSDLHGLLGPGDESLVVGNKAFESSSLWVEGVLEMSSGNSESDFGISESDINFLIELVMLSGSPSVLFLLRTEFEVKISDEVLESGDQFIHWALSLDLKFQ